MHHLQLAEGMKERRKQKFILQTDDLDNLSAITSFVGWFHSTRDILWIDGVQRM